MKSSNAFLRFLAVLFAFSMVAAACGSDSDSDSSSSEASSSSSEAAEAEEEEEDTGGTLSQDAIEKAVSGEGDDAAEEEVASDCPVTVRPLKASSLKLTVAVRRSSQ